MQENIFVYEAINHAKKTGNQIVLATVVRVWGSAYRREGAKMVIDKNKNTIGMISGGCLEEDVVKIATAVMNTGNPILRKYDMEEDVVWGLGLGCPGKVLIYVERL